MDQARLYTFRTINHSLTSKVARLLCYALWKPLLITAIALFLFFCLTSHKLYAAEPIKTLIIVPEASGPAKKIYDQVVSGVTSNTALDPEIIQINSESNDDWLFSQINKHKPELIIPIGNKSYKRCLSIYQHPKWTNDIKIVAGGISGKPNGIPTLSLTGSPLTTINHIKELAPDVQDIRLVYSDDLNGWWYNQAVELAASTGITIQGYRADNLQHGVKLYKTLIKEANKKTTAIWIPLKGIVPSKTILPLVLEKAWAKKLPVISNNPSHTRLGGLMALYPHHFAMGQQLAEFAINHYSHGKAKKIIGTDTLRIAINVRTSSHLGLRFDNTDMDRFDKVFPTMR